MKSSLVVKLVLFTAVASSSALAAGSGLTATSSSLVTMDFTTGAAAAFLGKTIGVGRSLLPFMFIVGLLLEAFGKSPLEKRDYGGVLFRLVVVLMLLTFYGKVFGTIMGATSGLAAQIAPSDAWAQLADAQSKFFEQKSDYHQRELGAAKQEGLGSTVMAAVTAQADAFGGVVFDAAVALIVLLGQVSMWIVGTFGHVLAGLLFILGPLALAVSVPRGIDVGSRWFRVWISVLAWPVISALLVALTTAFALKALNPNTMYDTSFASLALSGLLVVTAFAVPVISSSIVGGSMGAISSGWSSLSSWGAVAGGVAAAAAGGAGGVGGMVKTAMGSAWPGAAGGGGAGGGGSSSSPVSSGGVQSAAATEVVSTAPRAAGEAISATTAAESGPMVNARRAPIESGAADGVPSEGRPELNRGVTKPLLDTPNGGGTASAMPAASPRVDVSTFPPSIAPVSPARPVPPPPASLPSVIVDQDAGAARVAVPLQPAYVEALKNDVFRTQPLPADAGLDDPSTRPTPPNHSRRGGVRHNAMRELPSPQDADSMPTVRNELFVNKRAK